MPAFDTDNVRLASRMYLCTSFGDVLDAEAPPLARSSVPLPFTFDTAQDLLALGTLHRKKIAELMRSNECVQRSPGEVRSGMLQVAAVMHASIERGLLATRALPGGMQRRARKHSAALTVPSPGAQACALYATAVA